MRKLIVWNMVSLDGYYEGPGGDVMVLPLDGSFDVYSAQRMREADTLLLGHKTYDAFRGFWPSMADNDAATPAQKEISRRQNKMDKVVISDTLTADATDPWRIDRVGLPPREPNLSLRLIDVTKPDGTENMLARYEVKKTNKE